MLPVNLSDTAATSQDGVSIEFIAPMRVGSGIFRMQVAEGCAPLIHKMWIICLFFLEPFPCTAICHLHPKNKTAYPQWGAINSRDEPS